MNVKILIAALLFLTLLSQPFSKHVSDADVFNAGRTALEFGAPADAIQYFQIAYDQTGYRDCGILLTVAFVMDRQLANVWETVNKMRRKQIQDIELARMEYLICQMSGSNQKLHDLEKQYGDILTGNTVRNLLGETIMRYQKKYEKLSLSNSIFSSVL